VQRYLGKKGAYGRELPAGARESSQGEIYHQVYEAQFVPFESLGKGAREPRATQGKMGTQNSISLALGYQEKQSEWIKKNETSIQQTR